MENPAILVLEDGSVFHGISIGAFGSTVGEVVFNTAMTGYQEMLTDPSYLHQLVTLTYPHIGNVGINAEDDESSRIMASGLIVRSYTAEPSNFRAEQSLGAYLQAQGVVAIADIDTRRLTRLLRTKGALKGCIQAGTDVDVDKALAAARSWSGMLGADLASEASVTEPLEWRQGTWTLEQGLPKPVESKYLPFHVVAYDYGIKRNILRLLVDHGCRVTLVPAKTSAKDVLAYQPDGIFLSNGPGDPAPLDYAIENIKTLIPTGIPIFGICLGCQLIGLATGAQTLKMKFGHHGANHPVQNVHTGEVLITSQNHGFAIDEATLPACLEATHKSLFDGSLQGVAHREFPVFAFQGHPEASPGPHDVCSLFDQFVQLIKAHKNCH